MELPLSVLAVAFLMLSLSWLVADFAGNARHSPPTLTHDALAWRVDEAAPDRTAAALSLTIAAVAVWLLATTAAAGLPLVLWPGRPEVLVPASIAGSGLLAIAPVRWIRRRSWALLTADAHGWSIERSWPGTPARGRWSDVDRVVPSGAGIAIACGTRGVFRIAVPRATDGEVRAVVAQLEAARTRGRALPEDPVPSELNALLGAERAATRSGPGADRP